MSEAERAEIALKRAASVVARQAKVPVGAVLAPRNWPAKRLRQEAVYLAVTSANVPGRQAARVAALSHTQVQRALAEIEDRRDDPKVDARLARLERKMGMVA